MEGEAHPQDRRSHDRDKNERKGGGRDDSDGGPKDRRSHRRSGNSGGGGGGRRGAYKFDDQMEHAMCQSMTHLSPQSFPVTARPDVATMPAREIARTETSILLCDGQHLGPHLWPNGDEAL